MTRSTLVWTRNTYSSGPFTVIGVPGMPAGQAWRATADQTKVGGGTPSGRIIGYLTPGVASEGGMANGYTVVYGPEPYVPVDTCADVGGNTCAVTVGDDTYPATPGANGFHVVVLNRTTLALQSNQTVSTIADLHTAINTSTSGTPPEDNPVVHYVVNGGQSDQSLVIVQSVGNGKLTGAPIGYVYQDLSQLGGTPEALTASVGGAHPYALVGVANNLPWYGTAGIESSTVMATSNAPGQPTGQINGMLQRDRTGLYTPAGGNPAGLINSELYTILFQPAQDWPYANDPALPYIADDIGLDDYPTCAPPTPDTNIVWADESRGVDEADLHRTRACAARTSAPSRPSCSKSSDGCRPCKRFITNLLSPYEQAGSVADLRGGRDL